MLFLLYFFVGGLTGILSGMFGIGGGAIVVPVLTFLFARNPAMAPVAMKMAIATSLAIMIMTSLSALAAHARQHGVRHDFVWKLVPGLAVGALCGVRVVHFVPGQVLRVCFAVFLLMTGIRFVFGRVRTQPLAGRNMPDILVHLFALLTGVLSGMLGVGGGTLLVPFLLRAGLELHEAAATGVIGGLSIGLVATFGFMLTGYYINWPAFFSVALASVLLAPLGARLARRLPQTITRPLFGGILLLVAIDMLVAG